MQTHRSTFGATGTVARLCVAAMILWCSACAVDDRLPAELEVVSHGGVNGASISREGSRIAFYGDPKGTLSDVETVFLTHHRRDVAWAGVSLANDGTMVVAPAAELPLINNAEGFWSEFRGTRFHDYAQQSTKVLGADLFVHQAASGGRSFEWRGLSIKVLDTPGYTRGAVSYLVELDGRRIAFTGDLIYEGGRIFDLYSLQDSIEETETRGYHGYAARSADLLKSLATLRAAEPDIVVPVRGPILFDPLRDIDLLAERIRRLFRAYFRTDALRWYWGEENLHARAHRVLGAEEIDWMPMAAKLRQTPPSWWYKSGTSRLLVSDTKAAFLIDCGSEEVMRWVQRMKRRRVFNRLEGIFVTHFHDDHTDFVQAMAAEESVPVYAGEEVRDILEHPAAYHMPAMTDRPIRPVSGLSEGQVLRWHEFEFRYAYFPGQAIYHGGLDVKRDNGERYFFVGDSFSPSGLDDYCLLNRHLLHPWLGHFRCLDKIAAMEGDYWLVNQHIEEVFRYDQQQLATMREVLEEKKRVISELVPWEDPNFGIDEQWVRFYPYGQEVVAGQEFDLYGVILNHLPEAETFRIEPQLPNGWRCVPAFAEVHVDPRQEARVKFRVTASERGTGPAVLTAHVSFREHDLRHWVEAMIDVRSAVPATP